MLYFFITQFFEHFIVSYYSMNAINVIQSLGYGTQPILAYSIPALMMLGRLYAVRKLRNWFDAGRFFPKAIKLMLIGTALICCATISPHYNLAIFLMGMLTLNVSLTWTDWYMHETFINSSQHPRFSQAARLSNLSMSGIVVAMLINYIMDPQMVFWCASLIALGLWLKQPFIHHNPKPLIASKSLYLPLACHIGLSYTTFSVPFVLFRYWGPQVNSAYSHFADITLMILDIVIMTLMARWAKKYFQKSHFTWIPIGIGICYFLFTITMPHLPYTAIILYKIIIITMGCYYSLIVAEKTYLLRPNQKKKYSLENWVGKTFFGKLWLPATILLWQTYQSTHMIALWITLPAILTVTLSTKAQDKPLIKTQPSLF